MHDIDNIKIVTKNRFQPPVNCYFCKYRYELDVQKNYCKIRFILEVEILDMSWIEQNNRYFQWKCDILWILLFICYIFDRWCIRNKDGRVKYVLRWNRCKFIAGIISVLKERPTVETIQRISEIITYINSFSTNTNHIHRIVRGFST